MDRRKRSKHSRDCLPTFALRIRNRKGRKFRVIKVRNSGAYARRWVNYARWLWFQHRGPVPPGMRVIHKDGDTLNDALDNLVLGTAADVVGLWHQRNPESSARNYAACRAGTAAHNRARAKVRRLTDFLDCRWYPVDHESRAIVNRPVRKRWEVYGPGFPRANKAADAVALGWPGRPFLQACILTVLAGGGQLLRADVFRLVSALRDTYGWPPLDPRWAGPTFSSAVSELRRAGLVRSFRPGRSVRYFLAAGVRRGPVSPYVPVRGSALRGERYRGYEKTEPVSLERGA